MRSDTPGWPTLPMGWAQMALTALTLLLLSWSCTRPATTLRQFAAGSNVRCLGLCQMVGSAWLVEHGGANLQVRFTGQQLQLLLQDQNQPGQANREQYNVWQVQLDNEPPRTLSLRNNNPQHLLAKQLSNQPHTLTLVKRTEALLGASLLHGLLLDEGGQILPPLPSHTRQLLFVGDSITAGYGNEGADQHCGFTPDTENADLTYGAITGRLLQADSSLLAWSGRGLLRNADANDTMLLGNYVQQSLARSRQDKSASTSFAPQAIIVNVGTNDFRPGVPEQAAFTANYLALLELLRSNFATSTIVLTTGPMLSDDHPAGKGHLSQAIAYHNLIAEEAKARHLGPISRLDLTTQSPEQGLGCDWHPNLATHNAMAAQLASHLRILLAW